jgi:hypothetical protein
MADKAKKTPDKPAEPKAEDKPPQINELSDEQLTQLEERLVGEIRAAGDSPADANLEELEALAQAVEEVRTEIGARATAAAEREAKVAELIDRVGARTDDPDAPPADGEGDDDEPAADPATDDAPAADPPAEPATGDAPPAPKADAPAESAKPEPVAAAAPPVPATPAPNRPSMAAISARIGKPSLPAKKANPALTIVAGGDIPGFSAGAEISDVAQIGKAFAEKAHATQRMRGNGRFTVAQFQLEYPEERRLSRDNAAANEELIRRITSPEAIVAAGGLCAPVTADYSLMTVSVADRPIRDALARFNADRGGIRYIAPPLLSGMGGAVVIWTEANDTTPSSPTTKPCLTITCGTETEVLVSAVTKCLEVGNFNRKFFPEQFAAWWTLASAQHAREAETELQDRMCTLSTAVTTGQVLGTARDVLENLHQVSAAYRSRHRMRWETPLRFIAPGWLRNMMAADVIRQLPGDNTLGTTYQIIDGWIRAANINVTWDLDTAPFGPEGGGGVNPWPSTVETLLFHEGAFLFLDGGTLDFGVEIRDSSLNETNDVRAFMETFENVALVGVESLCITMDVCPSGETAAATDVTGTVCLGS